MNEPSSPDLRAWWPAVFAVMLRPLLWPAALRQVARLAPPGWWRHRPYLPVPDAAYLRFRLLTAYGDAARAPEPADVVTYLEWCRAWPRVVG